MKKHSLLLTVLCAVVSLAFLTGCGNNPTAVTRKWMKAIAKGDKETANQLVTGRGSKDINKAWIKRLKEARKAAKKDNDDNAAVLVSSFEDIQLDRPDIDENTATIDAILGEREYEFTLKKINGTWKLKPLTPSSVR